MQSHTLKQEDIHFQANLYESANPTRRWLHTARRRWVQDAIDSVSTSPCVFLEVGIGCGTYTRHLASKGDVLAIDINPEFVSSANQLPRVLAKEADITQTCFAPMYDVALCSEVIEHVPDSASALRNIFLSLKPGGHLILTTPNAYSTVELTARLLTIPLVTKLARAIYNEPVDDLGHINRLTRTQLRHQIRAAGFEVVSHDNLAFYLPGIAEFGGEVGLRLCQRLAQYLARTRLASLLWTQCWVLRRPADQ